MLKWLLLGPLMAAILAGAMMIELGRRAAAEAETAFADVGARARTSSRRFDRAELVGLPEIAQRYFSHAIAPGTPLSTTVRLQMEGAFLLGDKAGFQTFAMTATQILAPPSEFVWIPKMQSGVMRISGSDGLVKGVAWTRFRLNGLVPVVDLQGSPDLERSSLTRSAMEAIWAPASLLPFNGVVWRQTGPNTARLTFDTGIEPVDLTLDSDGRVVEISTMRWSDANAQRAFRLQPFGGTITTERSFGGFTIPVEINVGNHFGTPDYLPFFQAKVTSAEYLPIETVR